MAKIKVLFLKTEKIYAIMCNLLLCKR